MREKGSCDKQNLKAQYFEKIEVYTSNNLKYNFI